MVEGSETTEWELHFVVFFADIDVILFVAKHSVARVAGFLAMAKTAMAPPSWGRFGERQPPGLGSGYHLLDMSDRTWSGSFVRDARFAEIGEIEDVCIRPLALPFSENWKNPSEPVLDPFLHPQPGQDWERPLGWKVQPICLCMPNQLPGDAVGVLRKIAARLRFGDANHHRCAVDDAVR